jgi:hypothetical protein
VFSITTEQNALLFDEIVSSHVYLKFLLIEFSFEGAVPNLWCNKFYSFKLFQFSSYAFSITTEQNVLLFNEIVTKYVLLNLMLIEFSFMGVVPNLWCIKFL